MAHEWSVEESKGERPLHVANDRRLAWRGVASMVVGLAWVVFITVFALYWAPSLSLFQSIVVLIASIVAASLVVGIIWMAYGMRYGWEAMGSNRAERRR